MAQGCKALKFRVRDKPAKDHTLCKVTCWGVVATLFPTCGVSHAGEIVHVVFIRLMETVTTHLLSEMSNVFLDLRRTWCEPE